MMDRHREQKLKVVFITFQLIATNTDINPSYIFAKLSSSRLALAGLNFSTHPPTHPTPTHPPTPKK
jgi:hypothetical protein